MCIARHCGRAAGRTGGRGQTAAAAALVRCRSRRQCLGGKLGVSRLTARPASERAIGGVRTGSDAAAVLFLCVALRCLLGRSDAVYVRPSVRPRYRAPLFLSLSLSFSMPARSRPLVRPSVRPTDRGHSAVSLVIARGGSRSGGNVRRTDRRRHCGI